MKLPANNKTRSSQVQTQDLTESRLNDDFVFWLKKNGMNTLLVVLIAACAFLGYNYWQRKNVDMTAAAWSDMMNATLALTEMPKIIAQWVTHLPIPDLSIVILVLVLYVLLGCVMDELSMLLLTIPVIFPAIMGLDLWGLNAEGKAIWFGILVLMTVSIGMIAPPIGMNVYVVNSMAKEVPMSETYKGVMPFLVWDAIRVVLLLCFPVICLGLVKLLF